MSAPVAGSVISMSETERHGRRDRDFSSTWVPQTQRTIGGYTERHGRRASWVLVIVVVAAFCAGGVAIITHLWWLFWVCVGVVVVAVPAGKIVGIMDDTV
jgi:fatty acid desaturase